MIAPFAFLRVGVDAEKFLGARRLPAHRLSRDEVRDDLVAQRFSRA